MGPRLDSAEPRPLDQFLLAGLMSLGALPVVLLISAYLGKLQPVEGVDSRSSFKCPEEYKPAGGRVFREMVGDHKEEKGMF